MVRNAIQSDFWSTKMATGGHFLKNIYKKSCASDLNNVRTNCWPTINFTFGQYIYIYIYIYIQIAMLGMREYTLCSPFRANAHNSSFICYLVCPEFYIIRISYAYKLAFAF